MDLSRAVWRKSTRSDANGQCVEVADNLPNAVAVRDSKNPNAAHLVFTHDGWRTFTTSVKQGQFDLL